MAKSSRKKAKAGRKAARMMKRDSKGRFVRKKSSGRKRRR